MVSGGRVESPWSACDKPDFSMSNDVRSVFWVCSSVRASHLMVSVRECDDDDGVDVDGWLMQRTGHLGMVADG